jgi:aminodeoxyfutalosine synthase
MILHNPQDLILQSSQLSNELKQIASKVFNGERISFDEGVYLFKHANLSYLGTLANFVREKKNKNFVFFNRNFHVEPTNICV